MKYVPLIPNISIYLQNSYQSSINHQGNLTQLDFWELKLGKIGRENTQRNYSKSKNNITEIKHYS